MTLNLGCLRMAVSQDFVTETGAPEQSTKLRRVSEDSICKLGCDPAAYESRSRVSMPLHRSMHLCDCDGLMSCKAGA